MQVWINGKVMLSLFGEFDTPHLTANQIRSLYQPFSFNGANRCGKYMLRICNRTFSAKFRNDPKCLLFLLCKSYSLHNLLVFCKFTKYYANMCCCAILFYRRNLSVRRFPTEQLIDVSKSFGLTKYLLI